MKRLLTAELLKLRLTPSTWWITGFSLLLPTIIMLLGNLENIRTGEDVARLVGWATVSGYFTLLLGAAFTTAEFTHKTIVPTLLATPARLKVIAAQLFALVLWSIGIALASILIVTVIAIVRTGVYDISLSLMLGSYFWGSLAYILLSPSLGMAIGILTKNQVASGGARLAWYLAWFTVVDKDAERFLANASLVGVLLAWFTVVDPLLSMQFPELGKYTIIALGISLGGGLPEEEGPYQLLLPPVTAGLVYLGYAAIPLIVGLARFRKADIS